MEKSYSLRTLIVERETKEGKEAIRAMNSSKLPYELIELAREEIERQDENRKIPRLLSDVGFFDSLYLIEWYAKVYGVNGTLYNETNVQKPVIGLSNKHFMQALPSEYLFNLNSSV